MQDSSSWVESHRNNLRKPAGRLKCVRASTVLIFNAPIEARRTPESARLAAELPQDIRQSSKLGTRDRTRFTSTELDLMQTIAGHVAIAVDRQRGDRALRASEDRFRVALLGSPLVVFSQDKELRHTWAYNPAPGFERRT